MATSVPVGPGEPGLSPAELTKSVKAAARAEGFDLVGVAPASPGVGAENLATWIAEGRQGDMDYMARHLEARRDPNSVLAGVRSVVVVALNYKGPAAKPPEIGQAKISRYAWGKDYHDVLRGKLLRTASRLRASAPNEEFRAVVDSAPLMERDYARLAGLGWFGKNTLLLNRKHGSFFFLGALLTTAELEPDRPFEADHCGTCTRCLDACPTAAFDGPGRLDARKCISYLTIEHRGAISEALAYGMGDWIYGCDVCQDVCPWNRKTPPTSVAEFQPAAEMNPISILAVLGMSEAEFRTRFRGTPLFRAKRWRLVRNSLIAAVNQRLSDALPAIRSLLADSHEIVRTTAAWAVGRLQEQSP